MPTAAVGVPAIHAAFAPARSLLAERRALYRLTLDLIVPGMDGSPLTAADLDGPLLRHQVGEALAGRAVPTAADVAAALAAVGRTDVVRSDSVSVRVASDPVACDGLAPALRLVGKQAGCELALLTAADGERFRAASGLVSDGLRLAMSVEPELTADLVAHCGLVAILAPESSGNLVSASSRWFPGLVLLDSPTSALEVAEGLVHECAHQKFFDLAATYSLLTAETGHDGFRPSWSGAVWDVEQAVAACHAYHCLAAFASAAGEDLLRSAGDGSLLVPARDRALEIGRWLVGRPELEHDGQWLLAALLDDPSAVAPRSTFIPSADHGLSGHRFVLSPDLRTVRVHETGRVLVGSGGNPPELHWLTADAADVTDRVGRTGQTFDMLLKEFANEWQIGPDQAFSRVSIALATLADANILCIESSSSSLS